MLADLGLLILRVVVGLLITGHGAQKLFGWFNGPGLQGFGGHLRSMGLKAPSFFALIASLCEFGGGLLMLFGFLTPLGEIAVIAVMLMAIFQVHWPKVWNHEGGFEYPLSIVAVALSVALVGPGYYSLDAAWSTYLPMPSTLIIGLAAGVIGVVGAMVTAEKPAPVVHEVGDERRAA